MQEHKFEELRKQYDFSCGYCGVTEMDTGGLLTVDHFKPRSLGGDDSENNLVYACIKCNQYKWRYWPSAEQSSRQYRILHPLLDDVGEHLIQNRQTGILESLSETGRFHIALLRLNRPQLIKHRLNRMILYISAQQQQVVEQQIVELKKTIETQEGYIATLEARLRLHKSW